MAVRNEYVRLSLDDDFTTKMARAAAATALLRKSLGDLDGSGNGDGLTDASRGVDDLGNSSRRSGPEIDKLSGRLRLFRDAAITLGPALVPLGAGAIPLLTGAVTAFGAAAGGIGASILALQGMGDALKSIDAYQLEPTAENLQAMRLEMEKLGPAGAHFAQYLDSIEGQLEQLQLVAREGLLPGLEDGIDSALQRLPGVRKVIRELAEGMGELAASAGEDFKPGGDWDNFFHYLDTDGKSSVVSFGNALGDISNGFADLLVAFAPVTRLFTTGLEDMSQSFADWASGLSDSQDFQEFLRYIQVNGPRAIDMLGSMVGAFTALVEALAPVGATTLPILTKFLDLIAAIAKSPLGTPFIAAVGGVIAYNRAVELATKTQGRFNKAAAANPYVLAAAVIYGAYVEVTNANDDLAQATENAQVALDSFKTGQMRTALEELNGTLDETNLKLYPDSPDSFGDRFKESIPLVGGLGNALDQTRALWVRFTGAEDKGATSAEHLAGNLEILKGQTKANADAADLLGAGIEQTGRRMRIAAGDAEELQGALAELSGWLDKRQAIRDYNASIRELSRSMRNGFTRKDVENLDDIGRNIAQVASQISNPQKRAAFLEHAQTQLENLARRSGPKARAEIEKILGKLESLGLVNAEPTIDPNDKPAREKLGWAKREFDMMDKLKSEPSIVPDISSVYSAVRSVAAALNGIPDEHVKVYVDRVGTMGGSGRGDDGSPRVAARTTGRTTTPAFGRGSVGSDSGGKAEHFSSILRDGNNLGWAFTNLNAALHASERALRRETSQRDAVVSKMSNLSGGVSSSLRSDIFAQPSNPWGASTSPNDILRADIAKAKEFTALVKQLKAKGLDGPALAELLMSGDIDRARLYAAMSATDLQEYERLYTQRDQALNQAGQVSANAAYGAELRKQTKELREAKHELQQIKAAIKEADKKNQHGHERAGREVGKTLNSAARDGIRRGKAFSQ